MLKLLISPLLVAILVFAATGYAAVTTEAEYLFGDGGVGADNRPLDSSGNGWDIINSTGGATVSSTGGPSNDAYYSFNGAGGFWKDAYDPPENNVGVEAWVRTSNLTQTNRGVFGTGSSANGLALIYNSATDSWSGALGNVGWVGKLGAANYTAGDWIHLALVRDTGTTTFYVNGDVVGDGSTAAPLNANGDIHIGVSAGGATKYDGDIAYGRIFTFNPGQFEVADLNNTSETAQAPDPSNSATGIEIDLSARTVTGELSWTAPDDYVGATYDVYFGTSEPNELLANYGLTKLTGTPQSGTSIAPTAFLPLDHEMEYHWVVDAYDSNTVPNLYAGAFWSFTTIPPTPVIDTEPESATAVSADLLIEVTNGEVYEWYQVGNPVAVRTTGTLGTALGSDTLTTGVEGYYYCVATNVAGSATSQTVRVMTPRLVAHWTLDGTLANSSVDGTVWDGDYVDPNTAEPNPDDALVQYVTGADGTTDGAAKFNGYNLVEIPDSNEFFYFHKQGLTLTAWVLGPSSGNWKRPVTAGDNYGIVQHDSNSINGQVSGDDPYWRTLVPSDEGSEGKWRFVAITYEPNDLDPTNGVRTNYGIYDDDDIINVLHRNAVTAPTPGGSVGQNLSIGGAQLDNPDPLYNYDGAVDDVRVYNYALTPTELQQLYSAMTGNALCMNIDDPGLVYDVNKDCQVTMEDFAAFAATWLNSNLIYPAP